MNILPYKILKTLLALCLVTPLLMWSAVIFPYTVPKTFAFRILVEIAAVFYLYLVLKYPDLRSGFLFCHSTIERCHPELVSEPALNLIQGSRSRNKFGMTIGAAVLIFLAVYFLSAIFGVDFYASWWGDLERGMGVWGLSHFVLFFFLLTGVFRTENISVLQKGNQEISASQVSPSFEKGGPLSFSPLFKGGLGGIFCRQLLQVSVVISAIVSLLAILQKFASLGLLLPQSERVFGTIGNAGFLGTYLIFNIFFAGYLALSSLRGERSGMDNDNNIISPSLQMRGGLGWGDEIKINTSPKSSPQLRRGGKNWKFLIQGKILFIVYCLLFTVNCLALLLTGTRGAYLGLLVGIIVFLLLWATKNFYFLWKGEKNLTSQPPFKRGARGVKIPAIILLTIIIFIGLLFLARDSAFVKNNSVLSRLTAFSFRDTTAQNRLILWQRSWQAWQERPILGWGPENYGVAANKYFDSRLAPYEAWYDRAHNFIFDYGVAMGWLGLLGYLGIIFTAFTRLFILLTKKLVQNADFSILYSIEKSARKERETVFYFSVIFGALLAAYLIQNFFVFDTFVSYLMLFFVLALIGNFFIPPFEKDKIPSSPPLIKGGKGGILTKEKHLSGVKKFFLAIAILAVICSLYFFNFKPFLAARRASQILSLPPANAEQATPLLNDALVLNTFASDEIVYQATLDYLAKANNFPQLTQNENFYTVAAGELQRIIERSPLQLRNYIALAWLELYFSDRHRERIESAVALAQKAKELAPVKKDAYLLLIAGYSLSGDKQKAEEVVKAAESIDLILGREVENYWVQLR